jgi:hypothetical protein
MSREWRSVTEPLARPLVLVWGDGEVTLDRTGERLHAYLLNQAYGQSAPDDTLANVYVVDRKAERTPLSPLGMPLAQVGIVHRNTVNIGDDWLSVEYAVLKPGVDPMAKRGYEDEMTDVDRIITLRIDGRA